MATLVLFIKTVGQIQFREDEDAISLGSLCGSSNVREWIVV